MKLVEAINKLDYLLHNTYTHAEKVGWLSNVDSDVKKHIIDTHEGGEGIVFNGYDDTTSLDTELLVPSAYSDVYIRYLEAQIDYANAEYGKYNNAMAMYNSAYSAFERYYNRTHMPKGTKFKFF
jgi:hypothetical protein